MNIATNTVFNMLTTKGDSNTEFFNMAVFSFAYKSRQSMAAMIRTRTRMYRMGRR